MIAMLFEFWLNEEHLDEYSEQAALMRGLVAEIDGFISIERYRSATDPHKMLALGFFRDEAAVREWRNLPEHRRAQVLGRAKFFTDYRLRMAEVTRDYSMERREQAPDDSKRVHRTEQPHV